MRDGNEEMCCGFLWSQFIEANIDELINYCPQCGCEVK